MPNYFSLAAGEFHICAANISRLRGKHFTRSIGANFTDVAQSMLHHSSGLFQRGTGLRHDQLIVNALLFQKLNVRAALGNLTVVND